MNPTAFLLGAGASVAVGLPSTEALTDRVLTGAGAILGTDDLFRLDGLGAHPGSDEVLRRVLALLRVLVDRIRDARGSAHASDPVTYEDVYYLASQLFDSEVGEFENPGLAPLLAEITKALAGHLGPATGIKNSWTLLDILRYALGFIVDVVWQSLRLPAARLNHLGLLSSVQQAHPSAWLPVLTLNHDLAVEKYFRERGIAVETGFDPFMNGFGHWNPDSLDGDGSNVRLLKLHGSLNWFSFLDRDRPKFELFGTVEDGVSIFGVENASGRRMTPIPPRPQIAVGTFNKIADYTLFDSYLELHMRCYQWLKHADRLVVAGYGFGDKGINARIVSWLVPDSGRKLVVIDPRTEAELLSRARFAIYRHWEDWKSTGMLRAIQSRLEDVVIGDL